MRTEILRLTLRFASCFSIRIRRHRRMAYSPSHSGSSKVRERLPVVFPALETFAPGRSGPLAPLPETMNNISDLYRALGSTDTEGRADKPIQLP